MKKLILIFLFIPILLKAQNATVTISIPSNLDLHTIAKPNNTVSPVYLTTRTYLHGGPTMGDNGIPENRFYQMVVGTATGGISGMDSYALAYQIENEYIIQRSGFYFTTLKTIIHVDNVLGAQDSIAKWYGLVKGISTKVRIDSTNTALKTYTKSSRTIADSVRLNSEITRATATEATKEAIITASTSSDYYRGDKTMASFINAARASSSAGAGISYVGGVITNTSTDQTVTIGSGNRANVTGTYPNFTIAFVEPTINNTVTRAITGSTFTVSSTKQARVSYSVSMQCTATIGSAANGKLELQYSTNAGSTWTTVGTFGNSNTVTLAVVLNSVQISTGQLVGEIPAGALVRINPTLSGVNAVATYLTGQEIY